MKVYKAIFLDWDDTIGDWTTAEHKALQDIYRTYHLDRLYSTFEDYLNAYKPYNLELWGMYGRGEVTKEKLHFERFYKPLKSERLKVKGERREPETLAHEIGAEFLRLTNKYFCLLPDAAEVVKYLAAKYPLTIVSNGFKEVQYYKFEHSGLAPYLTHTLISEEVGINKPQPGIFAIALERNGITADEAIMIGDSYSSDIAGAKAAGIDQIWVRNDGNDGNDVMSATYIVPKITDIMEIL
ncbi:MAG: YjjG family noncanonical pyrimidine nucleotidase [Paludibacteraceae bacterium]|nr:YjjG family noncanonical pyrimidine nucleotidase [Paludibacteraceae bacterium]